MAAAMTKLTVKVSPDGDRVDYWYCPACGWYFAFGEEPRVSDAGARRIARERFATHECSRAASRPGFTRLQALKGTPDSGARSTA